MHLISSLTCQEAEHQTLKQGIPAVFPAHSFNIEKDKYYKL